MSEFKCQTSYSLTDETTKQPTHRSTNKKKKMQIKCNKDKCIGLRVTLQNPINYVRDLSVEIIMICLNQRQLKYSTTETATIDRQFKIK